MLKQLIQRLLDSRTTPAEAAHSAMPKPETPTIVSDPVTDKAWHSLIAPFDGYFSCKGITKHMLIENSAAQWSGVTGLTSGGYMGFTLPMSKGSEVRYQLDHNSTGVMMTFSKTIGGGYNSIIQLGRRTSICLSLSSNYLQKRFSRVDTKTLPFKSEEKTRAKSLLLLETLLNGAIQLRYQVTLPFGFRRLKILGSELIMSLQGCPISQITTGHGRLQRFQSKKETLSFSDYRPRLMFQRLRAGLLLAFVNLKLNKGGATC